MLPLDLSKPKSSPCSILCFGSHSDDIEIGCGGTILKLLEEYSLAHVYWVVLSSDQVREKEARGSADLFLAKATSKTVVIKDFRNGFFPYIGKALKEFLEQLKSEVSPDLILTHYRNDLHQDHRVVSELTWNTFRNHLILEYEIPKFDGDLGTPNVFIPLDEGIAQKKAAFVVDCFKSQQDKHWFDKETFLALMRLRGIESCCRYAEAFYGRKIVLG
jgi:LmbE family N-acetylglucosaminyl deacetylase